MILNAITSIVFFVILLSFLILIHELGHFLAAKFIGAEVEEFGLGYPPRAKKLFKKWGTLFSLNWIPFGGFVKIVGEEADEHPVKRNSNLFYAKPAWQKMLVILAGVGMNLLFAILIFCVVYFFAGIPTPLSGQARVAYVVPDSPAQQVGIKVNENVLALRFEDQMREIHSANEAIKTVAEFQGKTVELTVSSECLEESCPDAEIRNISVSLKNSDEIDPEREGYLGVAFQDYYFKHYPIYQMPFRAIKIGFEHSFALFLLMGQEIIKIFSQIFTQVKIADDIQGPFGIGHQVVKEKLLQESILDVLNFCGVLSLGLAVMNLLPIPALDGGRALFVILENIFDKKKVRKLEQGANYLGFMFLLGLIVFITARDLWRIAVDVYNYLV